jgi:hypothetical protein
MSEATVSISSEFDVFARKPIQTAVVETIETVYKPIAPVEQSDLEFLILDDLDTYIDLDIKHYIRGKLISGNGKDLEATDFTAVTNNCLHCLFSQCSVTLNGVSVTQANELYQYRSYLETLLTYGSDASATHLKNSFWYLDKCDLLPCDPTAADAKNECFITRWNRIKQSKDVQLYGRLHSDICNVPQYLIRVVRLQSKLTNARPSFYLMNQTADSKVNFKFLDAKLFVKRIRVDPELLSAQNTTLKEGGIARYNLTRVELKTFAFPAGLTSLSMDNAVLGPIPKRLLFTLVKSQISRFFGYQPVQFSTLQSQQFCHVCKRQTSSKRMLIFRYES